MRFFTAASLLTLPFFGSGAPVGQSSSSKGFDVGVFYVNWVRISTSTSNQSANLRRPFMEDNTSSPIYHRKSSPRSLMHLPMWIGPLVKCSSRTNGLMSNSNIPAMSLLTALFFTATSISCSNWSKPIVIWKSFFQLVAGLSGKTLRPHWPPTQLVRDLQHLLCSSLLILGWMELMSIGRYARCKSMMRWKSNPFQYPEDETDAKNLVSTLKLMRKVLGFPLVQKCFLNNIQTFDAYSAKHADGYHFKIDISAPAGKNFSTILI